MFRLILTGIIIFTFGKQETQIRTIEIESERASYYEQKIIRKELGQLADPSYMSSIELENYLSSKLIDAEGKVRSIPIESAIRMNLKNRKANTQEQLPFFEIKNTSKVILPVYGKGLWGEIWGNVVVDTSNLTIVEVDFKHKGETPGLGAEFSDPPFESKFINKQITFDQNNFALYQSEIIKIEGTHRIDGITGATITCIGAIEMVNASLMKYKNYFK